MWHLPTSVTSLILLVNLFLGACIIPQAASQPPPPLVWDPLRSALYIRCTPERVQIWNDAWDDAMHLASAAWSTLHERRNEVLVWAYWFNMTPQQRAVVENTFRLAADSGLQFLGNRFHFCCGDFQLGDMSSTGDIFNSHSWYCSDPEVNAYCKYRSIQDDILHTTNDIAGCAILNEDRTGSIRMATEDPNVRQGFCAETDFPHLTPDQIGKKRRLYFRGWTLLHELMHTTAVGFHMISQGPRQSKPHLGASDFAYEQQEIATLDVSVAVLNAESYANFAWDAFFLVTCGRTPKNAINPVALWVAGE